MLFSLADRRGARLIQGSVAPPAAAKLITSYMHVRKQIERDSYIVETFNNYGTANTH